MQARTAIAHLMIGRATRGLPLVNWLRRLPVHASRADRERIGRHMILRVGEQDKSVSTDRCVCERGDVAIDAKAARSETQTSDDVDTRQYL